MTRLILTGNFALDALIGMASVLSGGESWWHSAMWLLPSSVMTGALMVGLSMMAEANRRPDVLILEGETE